MILQWKLNQSENEYKQTLCIPNIHFFFYNKLNILI